MVVTGRPVSQFNSHGQSARKAVIRMRLELVRATFDKIIKIYTYIEKVFLQSALNNSKKKETFPTLRENERMENWLKG